ncbi:MAG: 2-phosphosulfolactate phosphatase [Raineya sp.]|jgi:2-phosphosulfolactate phosphatase|nr:2-phosphosulfolactate phosphatase [Raineya sp.]
MPQIDVCLSPELLHLYQLENTIVVVNDILRATSCMVTALSHGVASIVPIRELDDCLKMREKGYLIAAERDGKMVEGFDLGNSPFSYMEQAVRGKKIALTTTNGTQAIKLSEKADEILVGAFLNKQSIIDYLKTTQKDVLVVCSGWKGKVNLEDTLFAGAVVEGLSDTFEMSNDSALISKVLYRDSKPKMLETVLQCSHVQRLKRLGIEKDIEFCLTENLYNVLPKMQGEELVNIL